MLGLGAYESDEEDNFTHDGNTDVIQQEVNTSITFRVSSCGASS
jgi:hypothetical protein